MAQVKTRRSVTEWSGWDYLPGIAFIIIGVLAIMQAPLASLATGIYVGSLLCVAGIFAFVGGLSHIKVRGAWLAALLGLLSIVVGAAFLYNPTAGAVTLVWMIGAWLIVGGIFELATAFSTPIGRGWLVLVGIVDLVLGVLVLTMDPNQAFSFLGYYVGISFIFRGIWTTVFVGEVHETEHSVREALA